MGGEARGKAEGKHQGKEVTSGHRGNTINRGRTSEMRGGGDWNIN